MSGPPMGKDSMSPAGPKSSNGRELLRELPPSERPRVPAQAFASCSLRGREQMLAPKEHEQACVSNTVSGAVIRLSCQPRVGTKGLRHSTRSLPGVEAVEQGAHGLGCRAPARGCEAVRDDRSPLGGERRLAQARDASLDLDERAGSCLGGQRLDGVGEAGAFPSVGRIHDIRISCRDTFGVRRDGRTLPGNLRRGDADPELRDLVEREDDGGEPDRHPEALGEPLRVRDESDRQGDEKYRE